MPGRRPGRVVCIRVAENASPNSASSTRRGVEVPAATGGVGIERDLRRRERAEVEPRHVGDAEAHCFQRVELRFRQPGLAPTRDRGVDEVVELGLGQHAVASDRCAGGRRGRRCARCPPRHRRRRLATGGVLSATGCVGRRTASTPPEAASSGVGTGGSKAVARR